ncbi:hypothetical protein Cs7R123_60400 [Catellatospora sp. TT07R-123]|uniref:hypothetical protein n=1 Tax=Catellatospora sp. TT07R-123 TaxID=2733863 RepID=UPI001B012C2F|nr:hypothetical protein [Catellatospora sp. TT07R-123]GHJ48698.1 hypothetical protein Cs7R123_60400 [Catellatospora sp. TT07R-123]
MTTPHPSGTSVSGALQPLRLLFTLGLLGYTALFLFFRFTGWLLPDGGSTLAGRSAGAGFTDLFHLALPLVAVLIATQAGPLLFGSRLFSVIALAEYAFAVFFGLLAFVIGLGALQLGDVLQYLIMGLARLALIALAGYAVFRVFQALGGKLTIPSALRQPQP